MNSWVYEGFDKTYNYLGIEFDKNYYESETYILGKSDIEEGLKRNIFFRKEDNSVWIDLTNDGLDEKIVLRSDGSSVYMTQDIGTAIQRFKDLQQNGSSQVKSSQVGAGKALTKKAANEALFRRRRGIHEESMYDAPI